MGRELAEQSVRHPPPLRKLGITHGKTIHSFIAAFVLTQDHELLHADSDFDLFEAHLGSRVVYPEGG